MKPEELEAVRERVKGGMDDHWELIESVQSLLAHIDELEAENQRLHSEFLALGENRDHLEAENTKLRAVAELVLALGDVWTPEWLINASTNALEGENHGDQ